MSLSKAVRDSELVFLPPNLALISSPTQGPCCHHSTSAIQRKNIDIVPPLNKKTFNGSWSPPRWCPNSLAGHTRPFSDLVFTYLCSFYQMSCPSATLLIQAVILFSMALLCEMHWLLSTQFTPVHSPDSRSKVTWFIYWPWWSQAT